MPDFYSDKDHRGAYDEVEEPKGVAAKERRRASARRKQVHPERIYPDDIYDDYQYGVDSGERYEDRG